MGFDQPLPRQAVHHPLDRRRIHRHATAQQVLALRPGFDQPGQHGELHCGDLGNCVGKQRQMPLRDTPQHKADLLIQHIFATHPPEIPAKSRLRNTVDRQQIRRQYNMYTNNIGARMPAYARPKDMPTALALLAQGHRVLAGGTDVYPQAGPTLGGDILDITDLADLQSITLDHGLRIGAATTWTAIADATLPPALHALQQAAHTVGGRQIQNAGTIGGNLCNASPAADGIPPLLILNAEVELKSATTTRRLPLANWVKAPRRVDMQPGEMLTALHIPADALQGRSRFLKLGARSHLVISIAMVAIRLVTENGRITQAFAAVGSCSGIAQRLPLVEAALINGAPIEAAHLAALSPIDDIRATAAYRREAALELLRRAAQDLAS